MAELILSLLRPECRRNALAIVCLLLAVGPGKLCAGLCVFFAREWFWAALGAWAALIAAALGLALSQVRQTTGET